MPDDTQSDDSITPAQSAASAALAGAIRAHKSGRLEEAEAAYRRLLAEWPDCAGAHHMLGVALLQRARPAEAAAVLQRAIALDDSDVRYHSNLGSAYLRLGRAQDALAALGHALARCPEFLDARYNRGVAYLDLLRLSEAEADFRAVLAGRPQHLGALNNLGATLIKQQRVEEALGCFRGCLDLEPQTATFLINLALALERMNALDEAERAAKQALALDGAAMASAYLLARLDHRRGRLSAAEERLGALLGRGPPRASRIDLLFELGLVLDRKGEAAAAFAAFAEANALIAGDPAIPLDRGGCLPARAHANRAWFTRRRIAAFAEAHPGAAASEAGGPVFFVGFPRSGTTLVEQALKAHPGLVTTGEVSPLQPIVARLLPGAAAPAKLAELEAADVDAARAAFWAAAEEQHGPLAGRRLVDKLPLNIVDLGLVNLLFPEARVLVALRDPRDVCLSCFMQSFKLNESMLNFLDLARTAETYGAVMGLWLHYREALTLPWLEYRYEDLIEDFEGVMGQLLDFIGVGWHPDVARYRELSAGAAVSTPSYRDVGSALYGRAVGRWRAYREPLAPVLEGLRPFAKAFGYRED